MRILLIFCALFLCFATCVFARSAFSPRHSGIEPPGGPRHIETLPGKGPTRTAEGGMGYVDAYGNTLRKDEALEEKKPHKRLRAGAYGGQPKSEEANRLPDPDLKSVRPWKF